MSYDPRISADILLPSKAASNFLLQGLADRGKLCARKQSCCMKNQTEENTYPLNICTLKMQNADVPLFSGNGLVSWYPARFFVGENGALSGGSEMVQLESNIS